MLRCSGFYCTKNISIYFTLLPLHLSKILGDKQALVVVHKYMYSVACYVCVRTGGLRSKLVTDSLGWVYRSVQTGNVCEDSRIVGFYV